MPDGNRRLWNRRFDFFNFGGVRFFIRDADLRFRPLAPHSSLACYLYPGVLHLCFDAKTNVSFNGIEH